MVISLRENYYFIAAPKYILCCGTITVQTYLVVKPSKAIFSKIILANPENVITTLRRICYPSKSSLDCSCIMQKTKNSLTPGWHILRSEGLQVLLYMDLAELYKIDVKRLHEQIKRNNERLQMILDFTSVTMEKWTGRKLRPVWKIKHLF